MNFHELDNFNLSDAVRFHRRLNPAIWGRDEHVLPAVREKLLAIAEDFQQFLGVDDLRVQDITISGSNAAYSYTPHSDIDLHLVVDMPDDPVYQELFTAKKYQYNDEHSIKIGGVPVELYVQPSDQPHHSQGIYSIKDNTWRQVPQRRRARVDDSCVQHKAADLDARIHSAIKSGSADAINRLWDHIKTMRQSGLEKNGEFGCENIVFKLLRNQGCIGRLKQAKTALRDRELSLTVKPRRRVNYGMRDYWYPGTAYAGQDHPAGTESQQIDEQVGGPKIVVVGDSIALGTAQAAGLPNDAVVGRSTAAILRAVAANPAVQGADVAIVSAGTNDYPLATGGVNPNPEATKKNIAAIKRALRARQCIWILPFNRQAAEDVLSVIGNDATVDLAQVSTTRDRLHPTSYSAVANAALSRLAKPGMMESVEADHLKKILTRFYHSCVKYLDLKHPPRLRLETTPEWSKHNGSFGQYESETNTLILATSGRHVLDILRTMAHEMTHRQQDEREPLPIDAGQTGSPWEDQANAMAGRIMRHWAEQQPEMFDGVTLEEASGYIPTKAQARDPRFVMALTRDVRPGAVGKEANKLGLKTDSQGHPALLTAGLQKLLREFKEQDLFEIRMSPTNLKQVAAGTGARAGMEFEMIVPGVGNNEPEMEPDYDYDPRTLNFYNIENFFDDGDYNSRRDIIRLLQQLQEEYDEWRYDQIQAGWEDQGQDLLHDYMEREDLFDPDPDETATNLLQAQYGDDLPEKDFNKMHAALVQELIDQQVEKEWKDQGRAYDSAYEQYRDEHEDEYDEESWLSDMGYNYMSDIASNFNINWTRYTDVSGESIDIETVANDFSQSVGMKANWSDSYHGGRRLPDAYVVEPDSSLDADNSNEMGLEFVSPPMPIDQMIDQLNKVKKWADGYGCYTNKSTGLHINISVPGYSQDRLDYVKLALLLGDQYVLDQFGRSSNTYARSALGKITNIVKNTGADKVKQLLDQMRGHMGELATKAIHTGQTEKYTSINTKTGYIEFRSPGGDWLDANFDKIETTLLRFTVALSAAIDPAAYREEYLKKLYKLLAPVSQDTSDDTIRYFADYVAGKTPLSALRSFIKQAQLQRKVQRGDVGNVLYVWEVSNPARTSNTVEVVAKNKEEAIEKALAPDGYPGWRNTRASVVARPLRPYDKSPVQAQIGEPQALGPQTGVQGGQTAAVAPRTLTTPGQPQQQFTGRWLILDPERNVIHSFSGVGNAQSDANRVAMNWLRSNPAALEHGVTVVPEMLPA